jgi:hypothetical protein
MQGPRITDGIGLDYRHPVTQGTDILSKKAGAHFGPPTYRCENRQRAKKLPLIAQFFVTAVSAR